uniref:BKRF1 encodes EBNA-1-like protein n=1 Tax=Oryza sativa subsp. japonica TaxID=39947 RepID=Q69J22_ORYSJ|nr:BKRF1 encodes EBNA-1-like protein [Oryza sativa Japonica Group]BAD32038.1 BKRF1 encodes EBNA-1-like protein [Oryza sativa Japonica Group]
MLESRGFEGGMALGFTGEGERTAGREEDDDSPDAWAPRGQAAARAGGGARLGRDTAQVGEEGEAAWAEQAGRGEGGERQPGREREEGVGREGRRPKRRRERRRGREREGGKENFGRGPRGEREDFGPDLAQREEDYF